jgi:hypothetical protein
MKAPVVFFLLAVCASAEVHTLTLREALDIALKQNPDVILARLDQRHARAQVTIVNDAFVPKVFVGSGAAYTNGFPMSIDGNAPAVLQAKTQMAMREDQLIAGLLFQQISKETKPSPADLQAYYDGHKNEWETVTARHILIRFKGSPVGLKDGQKDLTDEEALAKAKDLRAKIVAGGDFAALAKAESDDVGSGANGGSLGEFTRGRMVPPFDEAAFTLKVNDVSEPVKTQFGYHVIQVTKHDSKKMDDVKNEITDKVGPELAQKSVEAIRDKAAITYDQSYFGK